MKTVIHIFLYVQIASCFFLNNLYIRNLLQQKAVKVQFVKITTKHRINFLLKLHENNTSIATAKVSLCKR